MAEDEMVFFSPKGDITLAELVEILRFTLFQNPASASGVYSIMPPELRRHFSRLKE